MKGLKSRKGQQVIGSRAAGLVAIILAVIIVYILFLPPKAREELLFGNETGEIPGITPGAAGNLTLLLEHPGRIEFTAKNEIVHPIPTATLFSKTEASELKKIDSIYVKNTWFSERTGSFNFNVKDLANTENVILSFNVQRGRGVLIISVNGKEALAKEVTANSAVKIPKEFLQAENTVEISVSGVGFAFWRTNEYVLSNIRVTADITGIDTLESKNTFIVSSTEKNTVETTILRFVVDCRSDELKILDISINDHNIYSAVPDCGPQPPLEFLPQYLLSGENVVKFKTSEGANYLIDQIKITSKLKELTNPVYAFPLSSSQFDDISAGKRKIILSFRFADSVEQKTAEIWVNGRLTNLNTKDIEWTKDVSQFAIKGSNSIELRPATSLFVVDLEVKLE